MSPSGPKRTSRWRRGMSAFGCKADTDLPYRFYEYTREFGAIISVKRLLLFGPKIFGLRTGLSLGREDFVGFARQQTSASAIDPDHSFVYVVKADNGLCKIGMTTNPNARLAQLRSGSASPLEFAWIGAPKGEHRHRARRPRHVGEVSKERRMVRGITRRSRWRNPFGRLPARPTRARSDCGSGREDSSDRGATAEQIAMDVWTDYLDHGEGYSWHHPRLGCLRRLSGCCSTSSRLLPATPTILPLQASI
jgi:hypothetical protein